MYLIQQLPFRQVDGDLTLLLTKASEKLNLAKKQTNKKKTAGRLSGFLSKKCRLVTPTLKKWPLTQDPTQSQDEGQLMYFPQQAASAEVQWQSR